jgi:hypothetical protein
VIRKKICTGAGAVDPRRLVQLGRDRLQPGEVDERVVAGPLPGHEHRDDQPDRPRVRHPAHLGQAEGVERGVHDAVLAAEDGEEEDGGGDDRRDARDEERHP